MTRGLEWEVFFLPIIEVEHEKKEVLLTNILGVKVSWALEGWRKWKLASPLNARALLNRSLCHHPAAKRWCQQHPDDLGSAYDWVLYTKYYRTSSTQVVSAARLSVLLGIIVRHSGWKMQVVLKNVIAWDENETFEVIFQRVQSGLWFFHS